MMERRSQRLQRQETGSPRRLFSLNPLAGLTERIASRKSWSPQHQSSLEVPPPRQIQSARNSLSAPLHHQGSIESRFAAFRGRFAGRASESSTPSSTSWNFFRHHRHHDTQQQTQQQIQRDYSIAEDFLSYWNAGTRDGNELDCFPVSPDMTVLKSGDSLSCGITYLERVLEDQLKSGPEMTRIEHISDLHYPDADPPCHFCSNQSSLSIHDSSRIKIVSGGRVRARDGSRDSINPPYINLPSPNVPDEESSGLFPGASGYSSSRSSDTGADNDAGDAELDAEPPASLLTRRRALVPPKIPPYNADSSEDAEIERDKDNFNNDNSCARARRSSIVVIPPMQICPGDLLVYSKVLTRRNNLMDWDGSTQSLATETTGEPSCVRKTKNSWSLLKLFDRSGRSKSESLSGLEEVLNCLQPSSFFDDQLSKYKGLSWSQFIQLTGPQTHFSGPKTEPEPQKDRQKPGRLLVRQTTQQDWSADRRTKFGLVRTFSERAFDRKIQLPEPEVISSGSGFVKDFLATEICSISSRIGSKLDLRRKESLWDLFQSECGFLYDHLMVLKNVYMDPLKKVQVEGYVMFAEPDILFGNLDELCCVTYSFCKEFITLVLHNTQPNGDLDTTEILFKLFQKTSQANTLTQSYHRYALNYINALNYLETLRRHVEFCEFEKWCNRDPRCKKLQLTDLLVAPVQHIMRIPILLREIEARTEKPQDKEIVLKILDTQEANLRELDDKMKWLKNFERLLEIQRSLVWPPVQDLENKTFIPEFLRVPLSKQPCERLIVTPRRQIVLEGQLYLLDSGRPSDMHVILFDDMLLITRKKKGLGKKKSSLGESWPTSCSRTCLTSELSVWRYVVYKQPLSPDRFFLHEVTAPEASSSKLENAFVVISINRFQQITNVHTFQASNEQSKQTWVTKIRETQEKWKRTLQSTLFKNQRTFCSNKPK